MNEDGVSEHGVPLAETALTTIVEHMSAATEDNCQILATPTGDGVGWMVQVVITNTTSVLARAAAPDFIAAVELACGRAVEVYAAIEELDADVHALADDDED